MSETTTLTRAAPAIALTSIDDYRKLAEMTAGAGIFGSPAQCLIKIMAGRELGFGVVASLSDVFISEDGKIIVGAHIRAASIRGSGRYDYSILKHTDDVCAVEFRRRNGQTWETLGTEQLTLADAQAKGMHMTRNGKVKPAWTGAPKNMLFARVMSNGYRFHTPDLSGGVLTYDPDELDAPGPVTEVCSPLANGADPNVQTPATAPPAEKITESEALKLAELATKHHRTVEDVRTMLTSVNLSVLRQIPVSLHEWAQRILTDGQIDTAQIDRIVALMTVRQISAAAMDRRLQEKYGAARLRLLTKPQADEVEKALTAPAPVPA